MKTLIRNARVVLPDSIDRFDVLVEDHTIVSIDAPSSTQADEVINANGLHLIPGVIDDQVHFREPGFTHKEDLESASRACAKGGVTSFLEMPNTRPTTTTLQALDDKLALAEGPGLRQPAAAFVLAACCRTSGLGLIIVQGNVLSLPAGWLTKAAAGCRSPK